MITCLKPANYVAGGGKMTLRYLYYEYKSEFVFGIILAALVAVSYALSPLIPEDTFRLLISPIQNCSNVILAGVSTLCLAFHHGGLRLRKICAWIMGLLTLIFIYGFFLRLHEDSYAMAPEGMLAFTGWEMVLGAIIAWLLLAYPTELMRPGWLTWKNALIRLLPVLVVGMIDFFVPWDLRWLFVVVLLVWVLLVFNHVHSYHRYCEENFSSLEDTDEHWVVRYLSMMFVLGASYLYLCFTEAPNRLFTQQWLMFFVLFYTNDQVIFRSGAWIEKAGVDMNESPEMDGTMQTEQGAQQAGAASSSENAAYREALEKWMEEEKPYLNPDFKLMDLRAILPTNRTYLSQLINAEYGCNFYQYVTNYRIAEAKRLMREHPELKMQEVAEQSGFASAAVFSRTFSRETGFSPREWSSSVDNS